MKCLANAAERKIRQAFVEQLEPNESDIDVGEMPPNGASPSALDAAHSLNEAFAKEMSTSDLAAKWLTGGQWSSPSTRGPISNAPRERLYVGLPRARDQLVVCGDPDFIREVGGQDLAWRLNVETTEGENGDLRLRSS
ncbi:MAG: hypothetical protein QOI01_9 [Mycobacterium sp.]|nr:hypothetical protein [Mycobacterium sp.]